MDGKLRAQIKDISVFCYNKCLLKKGGSRCYQGPPDNLRGRDGNEFRDETVIWTIGRYGLKKLGFYHHFPVQRNNGPGG
jgi:hypothetical protein